MSKIQEFLQEKQIEDKYNISIDKLNLSSKAYNCLYWSENVRTAGDIVRLMKNKEIFSIPKMGKATIDDILLKLEKIGISEEEIKKCIIDERGTIIVKNEENKRERLEMSIDILDLSVRTQNCLINSHGINTIGEIIQLIKTGRLFEINNLGKKGRNEIIKKIEKIGITKEDIEDCCIDENGKILLEEEIASLESLKEKKHKLEEESKKLSEQSNQARIVFEQFKKVFKNNETKEEKSSI